MKGEQIEVVRGSGNVFRDFGHEQADLEQFKAILAAEIIKMLDREGLSVRGALTAVQESPPLIFLVSATQTSDDLLSTAWCRSSTGSDRGSRSK